MKLVILAFVLACATTEAVVPKNLRFAATSASVHAPDAAADAAAGGAAAADPNAGKAIPLSTAMKCVMSLVFLYLFVTIILKVLAFKAQMQALYSKMQSDMAFLPDVPEVPKMPDMPNVGDALKEKKEEGEESVDEKAPLNAAEEAAAKSRAAAAEAAARSQAALQGTISWVTNMFSTEKMNVVKNSMGLVPMFCILVVFCRLRAKVDLQSEPQPFAKTWMVVSTACLFVQILTSLLPQFPEPVGEDGKPQAGISFGKVWCYITMTMDIVATLGLYGGIGVICYAIFTLKFKEFADGLPAVSPTA